MTLERCSCLITPIRGVGISEEQISDTTIRQKASSSLHEPSCPPTAARSRDFTVAPVEEDADAAADDRLSDVADFLMVLTQLRTALGKARGKIRVTDVQALAGLDRNRKSYYRMNLIARALRHLGWKRARYRFDSERLYGYARGTRLQRETILEVERQDGQLVVKKREP